MRRILVLGGTGAIGSHLVDTLAASGDHVNVTSRSKWRSSGNIKHIQGNAQLDNFLETLLDQKWDAIVDFMAYTTATFRRRAMKLLAATDHYVFLSSARVYDDALGKIREDSPRLLDNSRNVSFLATDEYSLAKARQENILRDSGFNNWTVVRPYITYSESRLQLGVLEKEAWLYRAIKGRTIIFSEDIVTKRTTMTFGLDVARVIGLLVGRTEAHGEAFHITQQNSASWGEVLDIYLQVLEQNLGTRPKIMLLGMDDFSRCQRARYQIEYDRLFNREFDTSKIRALVDTSTMRSFEQGLSSCLNNFMRNPQFLRIDWQLEAVKDGYTRELSDLREIQTWKQRTEYISYRSLRN